VAAEAQQAVHQLGAPAGRVGQLVQIATQLAAGLGRQRLGDQVRLRQDDGEQGC